MRWIVYESLGKRVQLSGAILWGSSQARTGIPLPSLGASFRLAQCRSWPLPLLFNVDAQFTDTAARCAPLRRYFLATLFPCEIYRLASSVITRDCIPLI